MKALIIGCGNMGSVAAEDLAASMSSVEIVVADKETERARKTAEKINSRNVSWISLDMAKPDELVATLKDFDVTLGFLPGNLGFSLIKTCIDAKRDLVDVSFMAENPLTFDSEALKANVTVVPDCGLAPGISNILVGHAAGMLDEIRTVHIMVGGLPKKPLPPLGYVVTWSAESLIDEYSRKASIVKHGKIVEVEALTGVEEVEIPKVGRLEAFYTDGLRTLIHTMRNADEMWEKTLRYSGHAEKIRLLKQLGFFEEKKVEASGMSISPRKVTAKLLSGKLRKPDVEDMVVLKVEVSGIKNSEPTRYIYHLLDFCDEKRKVSAMARTTAYPASIIAQLMLKKAVKGKGVVAPEKIGADGEVYKLFLAELERREIDISEEKVVD